MSQFFKPFIKPPRPQEELPAPAAHHQMESEEAASDETELDVIHSLGIKLYLTEKVKQF